jgi:type IV secretion system protein VirD4
VVQAGSVSFYEDCMTVALNVINKPKGGGNGNSEHFWGKAVQITTCLLVCLKEHNASASLVDLFHVVGDLRGSGDSDDFTLLHYPAMKASAFTAVQHMADELLSKRDTAGAEYESIISTISNSLQILGSPALQMALSSPSDITPQAFCASDIANKLFIIIPAHLMEACAPIIRTIFASVTIAQQRSPTRRLHLLIDEAGQLGHFEALLRLFSFGRGSKTRVSAIFQNVGQPMQHYGRDGFDTLFGNAQTKLFLGISSEATARYVSDYLGKQTYQYHAKSKQAAAFARQHTLLREMYSGGDVFKVLPELAKQRTLINTPESVSRPLMTPDELIHLPENEGILTIQGKGLRPYIYRKIPYFLNPSVAHHFLPNPFHAPFDRVKLPKGNGRFKTVHVITEDVPAAIAHKPQYQRGQWSYPKGYRPKLPRKKWFGLF